MISILAGTAVGSVIKYFLDKHWIFFDGYHVHGAELRKVFLYSLFSVGTTVLFWAVEPNFWHIWGSVQAK